MHEHASTLPSALRSRARWVRLGPSRIPALIAHPNDVPAPPVPLMLWMHGRTAHKELDPGRYLRLLRAGIGVCAVDLPGHGERFDAALQQPVHTLDVILQMIDEIDELLVALAAHPEFDGERFGIGGMSAGGMATMARLCRAHPFRVASVEAASGSWRHQRHREMFRGRDDACLTEIDPIANLDDWLEIPFQAIHARHDEWVDYAGQVAFVEALRARYALPEHVQLVTYERTGAPYEHAGFGRMASDAKDRQRDFVSHALR